MYCEKNRGSNNRPNDGAFYSAWHYINSDPHHMILDLSESQDAILLHILFSDYYLIYLFFDRPIFSKHQNIGTVFLPTVHAHGKLRSSTVEVKWCLCWPTSWSRWDRVDVLVGTWEINTTVGCPMDGLHMHSRNCPPSNVKSSSMSWAMKLEEGQVDLFNCRMTHTRMTWSPHKVR